MGFLSNKIWVRIFWVTLYVTKMDFLYNFTLLITVLELTITFYKEVTATKIESNLEIVPNCSKSSHEKDC